MKLAYFLIAAAVGSPLASAADCKPMSAEQVLAIMLDPGVKKYTHKKHSNNHQCFWDAALGGLETGKPEWLALAKELHKYTDGLISETYNVMLGSALKSNAAGVLDVFNQLRPESRYSSTSPERVMCGALVPDDSESYSPKADTKDLEQRRVGVSKVTQKELLESKQQCQQEIDRMLAILKKARKR